MWMYYRIARGAGHSVLRSLAVALFNRGIPEKVQSNEGKRRKIISRA
jgi:hypothetical protein